MARLDSLLLALIYMHIILKLTKKMNWVEQSLSVTRSCYKLVFLVALYVHGGYEIRDFKPTQIQVQLN